MIKHKRTYMYDILIHEEHVYLWISLSFYLLSVVDVSLCIITRLDSPNMLPAPTVMV